MQGTNNITDPIVLISAALSQSASSSENVFIQFLSQLLVSKEAPKAAHIRWKQKQLQTHTKTATYKQSQNLTIKTERINQRTQNSI